MIAFAACSLLAGSVYAQGYVAPDGRTEAQLIAAHVLPNPVTTPGVLNPAVSDATKAQTVCKANWTATVRPPVSYTDKLRAADVMPGHHPAEFELDHLLSIEDGGSPTSPQNLWDMIYADHYGARVKDVLETKMHRLYCAGTVTLDQARAALSPNWLVGYVQYVGALPK